MTRGKQDEKSAARIARSKPGVGLPRTTARGIINHLQSREANAALRAAERNRAKTGQNSNGGAGKGSSESGSGSGSVDYCQNLNRSGAQCSNWDPCDAHIGCRRTGT